MYVFYETMYTIANNALVICIQLFFIDVTVLVLYVCVRIIIISMYAQIQEYIPIMLVQVSSIMLGIGVLLLWCGLFGILSYFESLNVSSFVAS